MPESYPEHYLREQYGHRPHEGLDGATPWERFHGDTRPLRFPESQGELRAKFEVWLERRATADGIVSIDSVRYELPRGYAGQKLTLRRRLLDGGIGFLHEGQLIDLFPVDLEANARSPRARTKHKEPDVQAPPPPSAAELAYQRDFGAVVDEDGGFQQDDSLT